VTWGHVLFPGDTWTSQALTGDHTYTPLCTPPCLAGGPALQGTQKRRTFVFEWYMERV